MSLCLLDSCDKHPHHGHVADTKCAGAYGPVEAQSGLQPVGGMLFSIVM